MQSNTSVRGSCSTANAALLNLTAVGWRVEVLPPTRDAFDAGDRTFRCLAGPPGAVFAPR